MALDFSDFLFAAFSVIALVLPPLPPVLLFVAIRSLFASALPVSFSLVEFPLPYAKRSVSPQDDPFLIAPIAFVFYFTDLRCSSFNGTPQETKAVSPLRRPCSIAF